MHRRTGKWILQYILKKNFILLKGMNSKFNLDLKGIDIKELYLENKNLENVILEYLNKIIFNDLKALNLEKNNISDING